MRRRCPAQRGGPAAGLGRRQLLALLSLALPGLVGACGKKGDLRLPEPPAATESGDEETR